MHIARPATIAYGIVLTIGILLPHGGDITGIAEPVLGARPVLAHFLAFVVLGIGCAATRMVTLNLHCLKGLLILLAYAAGVEAIQNIVPGRTASLVDGLANVMGFIVGVSLCWCLLPDHLVPVRLRHADPAQATNNCSAEGGNP